MTVGERGDNEKKKTEGRDYSLVCLLSLPLLFAFARWAFSMYDMHTVVSKLEMAGALFSLPSLKQNPPPEACVLRASNTTHKEGN